MRLRSADLSWQRLGEDAVLLDLRTSTYFAVNATGADLVDALATGERTASELEALLLADYDVDAPQASADVAALLADLRERELLETTAP